MGLREKVGIWWLRRQWTRGLEGKEGTNVKAFFAAIAGLRTLLVALVLLAEFLATQAGHGGPITQVREYLFLVTGWGAKDALFDPVNIGVALMTIWAGVLRVKAWWAARKASGEAATAARLAQLVLLVALLPTMTACGSVAQLQIGANREHPDEHVVRSYVCQDQGDAARIYLLSPTFAWLGPARERYLVDAVEWKRAGGCGCPVNTNCSAPALAR